MPVLVNNMFNTFCFGSVYSGGKQRLQNVKIFEIILKGCDKFSGYYVDGLVESKYDCGLGQMLGSSSEVVTLSLNLEDL